MALPVPRPQAPRGACSLHAPCPQASTVLRHAEVTRPRASLGLEAAFDVASPAPRPSSLLLHHWQDVAAKPARADPLAEQAAPLQQPEEVLEELLQPSSPPRPQGFAKRPRAAASPPRRSSRLQTQLQAQGVAEADPLTADVRHSLLDGAAFHNLCRQCSLDPAWQAQVTLLLRLHLGKADLRRMGSPSHSRVFSYAAPTLQRKLTALRSQVGLQDAQLRRLLLAWPRVVEYDLDSKLAQRLDFLRDLGLSPTDITRVVLRAPAVLGGVSLESTLAPRCARLRILLGTDCAALGRLVARAPGILLASDASVHAHIDFLLDAGLSRQQLATAVAAHPQIMAYSVASMAARVAFLRGCGLAQHDIARMLARVPQLLSLDIAKNLAPKVAYLREQLGCQLRTLVTCPVFLTLSLRQRIIPRHRFLEAVRGGEAQRPFPVQPNLTLSDAAFAERVAGKPLVEYIEFKRALLAQLAPERSVVGARGLRL